MNKDQVKNLFIRTLSAIVVIAALLISDFLSEKGLIFFGIIVVILSNLEYARLCFKDTGFKIIFNLFSTLAILLFSFDFVDFSIFILAIPIFTAFSLYQYQNKTNEELLKLLLYACMGSFIVIAFPMATIAILKENKFLFFWFLFVIFGGDTGAYLVGSFKGVRPLLINISPKKTIEGAMGGIFGSVLLGSAAYIVLQNYMPSSFSLTTVILLSIALGVFGQIGDLFESLLKRQMNKKESGSIFPGHGGLLDRFDGLFFASPFFLFYIKYMI